MQLDKTLLTKIISESEVVPGNVYPAMGGKNSINTSFWLVISITNTGAHCIGFSNDGLPVSTTTYLKSALKQRPVVARVDLTKLILA